MVTIQSTDVNSYVKSLVEKAMNDYSEADESSDNTSHGEKDSLKPEETKRPIEVR